MICFKYCEKLRIAGKKTKASYMYGVGDEFWHIYKFGQKSDKLRRTLTSSVLGAENAFTVLIGKLLS